MTRQINRVGVTCRLPTEQEWEVAARAGTTTEFALPAPDGSDDIADRGLANGSGCGGIWDELDRTSPVGSFDPNGWGLHDMHGNVWEWCQNKYHDPDQVGQGGSAPRALRGGSWFNNPGGARASYRDGDDPVFRYFDFGFRVMCSSPMSR